MPIIFMDSFDHYQDRYLRYLYTFHGGIPAIDDHMEIIPPRRTGSKNMYLPEGTIVSRALDADSQNVTIGCGAYYQGISGSFRYLFERGATYDSDTTQNYVQISEDGRVSFWVYDGATPVRVAYSDTQRVYSIWWHFIEIQVGCQDSAGYCNVYINGQQVLEYSGETARFPSDRYFGSVSMEAVQAGNIDDLYISIPTTPPGAVYGDIRIDVVPPDEDIAATWSKYPATATYNFEGVDDTASVDLITYNYAPTTPLDDTFALEAPSALEDEHLVGIDIKTAMICRNFTPYLRVGSTKHHADPLYYRRFYTVQESTWGLNPGTGAEWTPDDLASLQIGYLIEPTT